jgi:uncharacterized protein YprB with RNaseH-like and TPR domain
MKPTMVCFDLETTNLRANFGRVLVGCFVDLHTGETTTYRADAKEYKGKDCADDSKLVEAIKEKLEASWAWIGWNSKLFDIAFLNTRLNLSGQPPVNKRMHIDLMYYARRPNLCLNSSRLDTVAQTFKLTEQKTLLDPETWVKAMLLDSKALDYITEHCIQDVLVLKEVFPILAPYIKNMHY